MNMSADYWSDWIGLLAASKVLGVTPAYVAQARVKYSISTQMIAGRTLYYKPDCERAAAERQASLKRRQGEAA